MMSAVAAARTILTRLHDVMASRSNAQAKLNTVVDVIGSSLNGLVLPYSYRDPTLGLQSAIRINISSMVFSDFLGPELRICF